MSRDACIIPFTKQTRSRVHLYGKQNAVAAITVQPRTAGPQRRHCL